MEYAVGYMTVNSDFAGNCVYKNCFTNQKLLVRWKLILTFRAEIFEINIKLKCTVCITVLCTSYVLTPGYEFVMYNHQSYTLYTPYQALPAGNNEFLITPSNSKKLIHIWEYNFKPVSRYYVHLCLLRVKHVLGSFSFRLHSNAMQATP